MAVRLGVALLLQLAVALHSSLFLFFLKIFLTLHVSFFFHSISLPFLFSLSSLVFCIFLFSSEPFCYPQFLLFSLCGWLLQACCCLLGLLHYFCHRMLLSVFWRREKPWISGLSPAKHKPGMTPTYTVYIHTFCVYTAELRCSFAWKWIQTGGLVEKREKRGCALAPNTLRCSEAKYAMKVCVALS